jgi:hypothetical protein
VSHEQHAQLVRWWNGLCRSLTNLPDRTIGSVNADQSQRKFLLHRRA